MTPTLRPAVVFFLALSLLAGFAYPVLLFALVRLPWGRRAEASLIRRGDQLVGSEWVGQEFSDPGHFWGRPSATVAANGQPQPYNAANSGGSNLAPGNPALAAAVAARLAALRAADPDQPGPVPADLVTASGSGLDPHISPEAAAYQVHRIARRRGLDEGRLRKLVRDHTDGPQFGLLGEPRVNVLKLNLALEALDPGSRR